MKNYDITLSDEKIKFKHNKNSYVRELIMPKNFAKIGKHKFDRCMLFIANNKYYAFIYEHKRKAEAYILVDKVCQFLFENETNKNDYIKMVNDELKTTSETYIKCRKHVNEAVRLFNEEGLIPFIEKVKAKYPTSVKSIFK